MEKSGSMHKIRLALELNEESGVYTVTSPDIPGLVTEGATPEEITYNVEGALQGLLEAWADIGMEAPVRSIIRQLGISREEFDPIK
jgi:antitoxin HicB